MKFQLACALLLAINLIHGVHSAVFTIINNCPFSIAPAANTNFGSAPASTTGFELVPGDKNYINTPSPWSGRVWARFECSNNGGSFHCKSGDCGSGQVGCNGAVTSFATLAEFTIGVDGKDTYDVSLVDGFNLPVSIIPQNECARRSCPFHINSRCRPELAARNSDGAIIGCKSACTQFHKPEYCCTGDHNKRETCPPTNYSRFFKDLCPRAYSYAYDDPTSLETCHTGTNYVIKFCP